VIYVYALIEGSPARAPARGIDARPLSSITCGEIVAVCSEHERKPEASEEALLEHEKVVEALMGGGPVVPMRFGQVTTDVSRLKESVGQRSTILTSTFDRLRERVEIGVRVFAMEALFSTKAAVANTIPVGASGRTYMASRLRQERIAGEFEESRQKIAEELHGKLDILAETSSFKEHRGRMVMACAYLVPRAKVDDFVAMVRQLKRDSLGKFELVCTGPWPPYSFVDVDINSHG
jgi:hypothetical protein